MFLRYLVAFGFTLCTISASAQRLAQTHPSGAAGKAAVDNAISAMTTGMISALAGVVFPLIAIGFVALFVLKVVLPRLLRGWASAPSQIVRKRTVTPTQGTAISRAVPFRGTPPPIPVATRSDEAPTLDLLSWDNFELLIGELFRRKGYAVEISSGLGADGGKDLTLRKNDEFLVVQCKKLARHNRVSESQMRDFFGLITAESAIKGFFVTTGYFSANAKRFATGKPIELLERSDIENLIAQLSAPGENLCNISSWIDTFVSRVQVIDPVCQFCDRPMKLRRGALGKLFWGCSGFPRCKGNRNGREELLLARQWQGP